MRRPASQLVPPMLVLLAACGEDRSPTAPSADGSSAAAVTAAAGARVVNSLADPGNGVCNARECTLREAIEASGTTAITFASGLTGTITLAPPAAHGGPLAITKSLTITAPAAGITVRRRSTDPGFRILRVGDGVEVTLTRLTLRNGRTDIQGAGLVNFGRLTLVNCAITGNTSTRGGGGIENKAALTLKRTTVSGNTSPGGAGIDNDDARLVATNSVIAGNDGTGILNRGGSLKLINVRVSDNTGAGVSEDRGGASTLERVRIVRNTSVGYALSQRETTISHSTISGNGGGVVNSIGGHLTISKSTISGNSTTFDGGGLFVEDDPAGRIDTWIHLVNSTVAGNSARTGGGVMVDGNDNASISIVNSTIASNTARVRGGGVAASVLEFGGASLFNSIVAGNTAPDGPDVVGDVGAEFTLIGDGTGSGITNTNGNKVGRISPNAGPIDPRLGPLADNGGPTRTYALLAGSPAIDAASADHCPGKDQRDVGRPRGAACDMGSFER